MVSDNIIGMALDLEDKSTTSVQSNKNTIFFGTSGNLQIHPHLRGAESWQSHGLRCFQPLSDLWREL